MGEVSAIAILSEEMQDVGEQELLMLLLMMTAELDPLCYAVAWAPMQ